MPKLHFEIFPQQLLDLHEEVRKHPLLLAKLHEQEDKDVYIQLLEIATYCELAVQGDFTHQEILDLCALMTRILYQKRSSVIIPFATLPILPQ